MLLGGRLINLVQEAQCPGLVHGINERGTLVGETSPAMYSPYSYSAATLFEGGAVTALDSMARYGGSAALDVNDYGIAVGRTGQRRAASFSQGSVLVLNIAGATSEARGINNRGLIVGYATVSDGYGSKHAFAYENGVPRDLGTLGGRTSAAYGVNNAGVIVGEAAGADGIVRAVVFGPAGPVSLGAGGISSRALAVNERGQIVGAMNIGGTDHPFLYSDGRVYDLFHQVTCIGLYSGVATSINDLGQIVGYGDDSVVDQAFLLSPEDAMLPPVSGDANAYCFANISDGSEGSPRFYSPHGIGCDASGRAYVADQSNGAIRRVDPDGTVTTISSCFNRPAGLVVAGDGSIYVSDIVENTISRITRDGVVELVAGIARQKGSTDGPPGVAMFNAPQGLALDRPGNLYVADEKNHVIRRIAPDGTVSTIAGAAGVAGAVDGQGPAARFSEPQGVAVDEDGIVYVADSTNHTIRKIMPDGTVSTIAGTAGAQGAVDAKGAEARFDFPAAIAVASGGVLFVGERGNNAVRRIEPDGAVSSFSGKMDAGMLRDGGPAEARFDSVWGIAIAPGGGLVVSDMSNCAIRRVSASGDVFTLAGTVDQLGFADGKGLGHRIDGGLSVCADEDGNVYVADYGRSIIQRRAPNGTLSVFAGTLGVAGHADGPGQSAQFAGPVGMAIDRAGNIYVADQLSRTIRKISPLGVVATIAGTPWQSGTQNGSGASASFVLPMDLAVDGDGNLYVADQYTGFLFTTTVIRKIAANGLVTSLAGYYGPPRPQPMDGVGADAYFHVVTGIAVDAKGDIYACDSFDSVLRKITREGVCSTVAGVYGSTGVADGFGSDARFGKPSDLDFGEDGNLYISDGAVRVMRSDGYIETIFDGFSGGMFAPCFTRIAVAKESILYGLGSIGRDGGGRLREYLVRGIPGRLQPRISEQPVDAITSGGSAAVFSVGVTSTRTPRFRWEVSNNGIEWGAVPSGPPYSGEQTAQLVLTSPTAGLNGYRFRCVVSNGVGSVVSEPALLAIATQLASWRQQQFGTTADAGAAANDADPDLDGRCNLLEYALDSVPTEADSGRPADVGSSTDGAGTHLTLTFNRIADPTLTYTVEASDDLAAWTTIWTSAGAQNVAGSVVVTDSETVENHPRRFLRLRVSN